MFVRIAFILHRYYFTTEEKKCQYQNPEFSAISYFSTTVRNMERKFCMSNSIRVLSFNLLYGGHEHTPCALERRRDKLPQVIRQARPDLCGCQEAVDSTRAWLAASLAGEYAMAGCGRGADCRGEGCPVLWRTDRFEMLSFDTFWLSDTPQLPGSRLQDAEQSSCPRLAHTAYLYDYIARRPVLFINTHLDHCGQAARERELAMLAGRIAALPRELGCVLTGDFNVTPELPYFAEFVGRLGELGWRDATAGIPGTFHGFGGCNPPAKIDYIFTNATVLDAGTVADPHPDGAWYSDHYAVWADLQF